MKQINSDAPRRRKPFMGSELTAIKRHMSNTTPKPLAAPADAVAGNWVDKFAPATAKPYLRLMRADRPIGTWLLLIPCLWGLGLALLNDVSGSLLLASYFSVLFVIGAFVMRGAGCAYNDIVDKDFDEKVERTALRPIPSGQITLKQAWLFLAVLCFIGLTVLLQFNRTTILLGLSSLALVAIYPFMKRITWWPQAWLGLTFNWGVLVGYAALADDLSNSAILLYIAGVFWTLGYDTIYAHQDKEDDALIGVKSSARRLGKNTRPALIFFYSGTLLAFISGGVVAGASIAYHVGLAPAAGHFIWQVRKFSDQDSFLQLFKSNRDAGFLLLAPFLLEAIARTAYIP